MTMVRRRLTRPGTFWGLRRGAKLPRSSTVAAKATASAALSWAVTARLALDMSWMALGTSGWTAGYFTAMFLMWVVMMVAMMVPSAAPTILLYAALQRDARLRGTALFTAGYLAAWTAFSWPSR